jgi:hypothetical protein
MCWNQERRPSMTPPQLHVYVKRGTAARPPQKLMSDGTHLSFSLQHSFSFYDTAAGRSVSVAGNLPLLASLLQPPCCRLRDRDAVKNTYRTSKTISPNVWRDGSRLCPLRPSTYTVQATAVADERPWFVSVSDMRRALENMDANHQKLGAD